MIEATRLLAFAFACADLLFEIDREGRILFATGATSGLTDGGNLIGRPAAELFQGNEQSRFKIIVRGISAGDRVGPLPMTLSGGAKVMLAMCYLPQNKGVISCTLTRPGKRIALGGATDEATGLPDRESFLAAAAASAGSTAALALVDLPNLPEIKSKLSSQDAQSLLAHIGNSVKAMGASAAGRISETSFGVVTSDPRMANGLANRVEKAARERGVNNLQVEQTLLSMQGRGLTAEQTMLAMRYVIGKFTERKMGPDRPADLSGAFDSMMKETLERANKLTDTIADGAFNLVFEPIVDLNNGTPSHYEALTRFKPDESPAELIGLAEELGLANGFDFAVATKVFAALEKGGRAHVALNISGGSISTPSAFALLAGLFAKKRAHAKHVLIEITESSDIEDLVAAEKAIQCLRQLGYRVGIDDFGAGAASLRYLHAFTIDFVKFDGAVIQRLGKSSREDALLKSVLQTCKELDIETIAEWIDSPEKQQLCTTIGFQLGQGRHFGAGLNDLPPMSSQTTIRARREGVRESWQ